MLASKEVLDELDRVTAKAKLIHKIEVLGRQSENASTEKLFEILQQLKAYRDQIRALDQRINSTHKP